MHPAKLRVLGEVELQSEDSSSQVILAQPKRLALAVYLCLAEPRGFHRRDALVALLWPDADQEHARASLRNAVHYLRRAFGADAVVSRGDDEIAVNQGRVTCDAVEFLRAAEACDLDGAATLYQGDLLPGFFASSAAPFEEWLEGERSHLRGVAAQVARRLSASRGSAGDADGALVWARRVTELAPDDEVALRRLVTLLAAAGDHGGALRAYHRYAAWLHAEFDAEPAPETRLLVERLGERAPAPPPVRPAQPDVRGREAAEKDTAPGPHVTSNVTSRAAAPRRWRATIVFTTAAAVVVLAAVTTLRAFGVSPFRSLLESGRLTNNRLVIGGFNVPHGDTILGTVVAEAVRMDLAQSEAVALTPPGRVTATLQLMRRPDARFDLPTAREVAVRLGAAAVVAGDVAALDAGYVINLRVVSADSGQELRSVTEYAEGGTDFVPALGRATRRLRARIGEPMAAIRATPPLPQFTTQSLPALRKFAEALAASREGQLGLARRRTEEAVLLDSNFAMAYVSLGAGGVFWDDGDRAARYLRRAFELSDHLPERERHSARAAYYAARDPRRAIAELQALVTVSPSANNYTRLAISEEEMRDFAPAEAHLRTAATLDTTDWSSQFDLELLLRAQGRFSAADSMAAVIVRRLHSPVAIRAALMYAAYGRGDMDSVVSLLEPLLTADMDPAMRFRAADMLAGVALLSGRVRLSARAATEVTRIVTDNAPPAAAKLPMLTQALQAAVATGWFRDDTAAARRLLDSALARTPLSSIPPADRPIGPLAMTWALVGRPDRARQALERARPGDSRLGARRIQALAASATAWAEHRYRDGLRLARAADEGACTNCASVLLALNFDAAGQRDSAIVAYTQFVRVRQQDVAWPLDAMFLAWSLRRLGALNEAAGRRAEATVAYERFVALWRHTDPELQPAVREARRALARAQGRTTE